MLLRIAIWPAVVQYVIQLFEISSLSAPKDVAWVRYALQKMAPLAQSHTGVGASQVAIFFQVPPWH